MSLRHQKTLAGDVGIEGVGVHSGKPAHLVLHPAPEGTGIVFVDPERKARLRVTPESVASTDLSTLIGDPAGFHISTVEHLMSALAGLGVDNVEIEISGFEIPILDGSAIEFLSAIEAVGTVEQARAVPAIRVLKPVRVEHGTAWAQFAPYEGTRFAVEIDFPSPAIGHQKIEFDLEPLAYRSQIAPARTFGFMRDVERLWAAGLALGSSLENSVVIGEDDGIVNPQGLRFPDEFVRHKALDAVGDIAVCGAVILGQFSSYRGGHKLNAAALRALLASDDAFERI